LSELREKEKNVNLDLLIGISFDDGNLTLKAMAYWHKNREEDVLIGGAKANGI
jgi:hypothetical protein